MSKQKAKKKKSNLSAPKKSGKSNWYWAPLILTLFTFLLNANTLGHQWALDDHSVIKENYITKKGVAGLGQIFTTSYRAGYWSGKAHHYRPMPLAMFAVEWQISPDNPSIHHWMNVIFMAVLAYLLFLLLKKITKSEFWSIITCLLFIAHPLHVEVIANIKSRDEIMAFLFMTLAMLSWWKFHEKKNWLQLGFGILACFIALLFKENAITLLGLIVLIPLLFFREKLKSHSIYGLLYAIPALVYLKIRADILNVGHLGSGTEATSPLDNLLFAIDSPLDQLATALMLCGKYFVNLLFPLALGSDFGYDQIKAVGIMDWRTLLSIAFIGTLLFGLYKFWNRNKVIAFGIAFFGITFSIFSNLIIKIGSSYGDRFVFIASFGIILAIVFLIRELFPKLKSVNSLKSFQQNILPGGAVLLLLLVFYSFKTIQRNPAWKDSYTLYKTDVVNAPGSAKLNYHYALECALKAKDAKDQNIAKTQSDLAAKHFQKAIEIYPEYADAHAEFGLLFYRAGNPEKAIELYQRSIEIKPYKASVFSNMGIIYFNNGQLEKAEEVYKKAITLDSRFVDAYRNLGSVYARQQRFSEAIVQFRKALEFAPNSAVINFFLGSALRDSGKLEEAKPYLEKANRLDPSMK